MTPDPYGHRQEADRKHISDGKDKATFYRQQAKSGTGAAKPAFVRTREWFDGMPDAALNAGVRQVVPETLEAIGRNWFNFTFNLGDAFGDVHRKNEGISAGLAGKSVQAASAATQAFAKAGAAFADENSKVVTRIASVHYAAGAVKMAAREIPASPGYTVAATDTAAQKVREYSEAKAQTLDALNNILKPNFWPAGDGVPTYTPPPDIANGPGAPNSVNGPGMPGGTLNSQQLLDPGKRSGVPDPNAAGPENATTAANTAPAAASPAQQQPGPQPAPGGPSTTAASTPNSHNPHGPNPVAPYCPRPAPAQGRHDNEQQANNVAAALPVAGRPGGVPAAVGAPGVPGAGMPRPPVRRKEQEEEETRNTPSYLITAVHGSELLGKPMKAVPPVIGAWDYENDRPLDNQHENR